MCGDLNFASTNWRNLLSNSEQERRIIVLLDFNKFQQEIKFPTWSHNTLDVSFRRNITLSAAMDKNLNKFYDCSDHVAVKMSFYCPIEVSKPLLKKFQDFRVCGLCMGAKHYDSKEF